MVRKKNKKLIIRILVVAVLAAGFSLIHNSKYSRLVSPVRKMIITPAQAADFSAIIASAGSDPVTLKLTSGTYDVTEDLDIPHNVTLNFESDAIIVISDGATLSIKGSIDDTTGQIFIDQNNDPDKGVKFYKATITQVRPEWWGAKNDNNPASASANVSAINKAANSYGVLVYNGAPFKVLLQKGAYYIDQTITIGNGVNFTGMGIIKTLSNQQLCA